jgi:hypothetical protein
MRLKIQKFKAKRLLVFIVAISGEPAKSSGIPEGPISANPLVNIHL